MAGNGRARRRARARAESPATTPVQGVRELEAAQNATERCVPIKNKERTQIAVATQVQILPAKHQHTEATRNETRTGGSVKARTEDENRHEHCDEMDVGTTAPGGSVKARRTEDEKRHKHWGRSCTNIRGQYEDTGVRLKMCKCDLNSWQDKLKHGLHLELGLQDEPKDPVASQLFDMVMQTRIRQYRKSLNQRSKRRMRRHASTYNQIVQ